MRFIFLLPLFISSFILAAPSKVPLKDRNSYLRIEINGVPDRIVSKAEKSRDYTTHYASWYGDKKDFVLVLNFKAPLTQKWTDAVFTFVPNRSGRIWIRIGGRWSRFPEERNWLVINSVSRNGKLMPNGDFTEYREKIKNEEYRPMKWILGNRAQYYVDAGENKTPACVVNHDNPVTGSFDVRAGEANTITIRLKAAKDNLIPKPKPQKKSNWRK